MVDTDSMIKATVLFGILAGLTFLAFSINSPGTTNPVDSGEQRYDLNIRTVVSGATDGAGVKSVSYTTRESKPWSFSFVGPSGSLSFTGAENVQVRQRLFDGEGDLVARKTENLGDIRSTEEKTVTLSPTKIPSDVYNYKVDMSFECSAISDVFGCPNEFSTERSITVPEGGATR